MSTPRKSASATLPSSRGAAAEVGRRERLLRAARHGGLTGQALRFGFVGILNTVVDFGILNLLHFGLGVPLLPANTIAVFAGILNSFLWNKHFTFRSGGWHRWRQELGAFLAVSLTGLLVNDLGIAVLHLAFAGTSPLVVNLEKLGASVLSLIWNFVGYRQLAFRTQEERA